MGPRGGYARGDRSRLTIRIRPARPSDAILLPAVEVSAGASFRDIPDLAWIADDEVGAPDFHAPFIEAGTVWVADAEGGEVVGFLSAEHFGPDLHIWEVAVAHEAQKQGVGRRLIDEATRHARKTGLSSLTLTTFQDVAWNAPFYARIGFEAVVPDTDNRLRGILEQEAERGLSRRCAMRMTI